MLPNKHGPFSCHKSHLVLAFLVMEGFGFSPKRVLVLDVWNSALKGKWLYPPISLLWRGEFVWRELCSKSALLYHSEKKDLNSWSSWHGGREEIADFCCVGFLVWSRLRVPSPKKQILMKISQDFFCLSGKSFFFIRRFKNQAGNFRLFSSFSTSSTHLFWWWVFGVGFSTDCQWNAMVTTSWPISIIRLIRLLPPLLKNPTYNLLELIGY